jgi:hypothetical protein
MMKLMKWDEFKNLPPGTIYQDWEPHRLSELKLLGTLCGPDFVCADLMPACITGDNLAAGHDMERAGFLIAHPSGFGRDGLFDHDSRHWLVWSQADRARLADWLINPVAAVDAQNTDDILYPLPEEGGLSPQPLL